MKKLLILIPQNHITLKPIYSYPSKKPYKPTFVQIQLQNQTGLIYIHKDLISNYFKIIQIIDWLSLGINNL